MPETQSSQSPQNSLQLAAMTKMLGISTPVLSPKELIAFREYVAAYITQNLTPGLDYDQVPGTKNMALLKPGAETLCIAFNLKAEFEVETSEVDHRGEYPWRKVDQKWEYDKKLARRVKVAEEVKEGVSIGLYRYKVKCRLKRKDDDKVIGEGSGVCSSRESKYVDRPQDLEHTIMAMAEKRAHVRAVVMAFGLTGRFVSGEEERRGERVLYTGADREKADLFRHLKDQGVPSEAHEHFHVLLKGRAQDECTPLLKVYWKDPRQFAVDAAAKATAPAAGGSP
jgi:hypothetical protein